MSHNMDGRIIEKSSPVTSTKCSIDVLSTHLKYSLVVVCLYLYPSGISRCSRHRCIAFACRPLSYFWEQYTNLESEGMCIDISQFFSVNRIAAVLIDVMILCIPTPIIWRLQMPKTQRLAVIISFYFSRLVNVFF